MGCFNAGGRTSTKTRSQKLINHKTAEKEREKGKKRKAGEEEEKGRKMK